MDTINVEICTNAEWLADGHDVDGTPLSNEDLADVYFSAADRVLTDAGFQTSTAQGQRVLYHGWNGSRFHYRTGGVGTWDHPTAEQRAIIDEADAAGKLAMAEAVEAERADTNI